jgi:hypothetical protein
MIISLTIALLIIILIVAIVITSIIWLRRKKYTRERFAFAALSTISTFFVILVTSVAVQESPWQSIIVIISKLFGAEYVHSSSVMDYLFLLLIFYISTQTIYRIHLNWDGPISTNAYKRENRSEPNSLTYEGLIELKRIINKLPPPETHIPLDTSNLKITLESPEDSISWHLQARELLMLKSRSYYFDSKNWHDQHLCWVGENKKAKGIVILNCITEAPGEKNICKFINYVNILLKKYNHHKDDVELFIAVKSNVDSKEIKVEEFTIKIESEYTLLDGLVDFSEYFVDIKYRVEKEKLPDSNFCLENIYVPSNFRLESSEKTNTNIEIFLNDWMEEPTQRQLALLGEYGQGKSTCTLLFTHHLLTNSSTKKQRIPILLELRGKSPRDMTPIDLLATWAARYNINPNSLMKLLIAGKLLLILEGFDEMALIGNTEMRLNHFRTLWQFCYPKSKILITGRPNFFLDDLEMKAALGIREPMAGKPFCQAIHLVPFSLGQIEHSLRDQDPNIKKEIIELAKKDIKFKEIASRPSLLFIVSLLWKKENLSEYQNKINSAFVMNLFIKNSYRRQGVKIEDGIDFMALNAREREYFMKGIAVYMASNSLPNQITKDKLHDIVLKLCENIPDSVSMADAMSGEVSQPLRNRMKNDEHALEHIKTDVRACGLLVSDPTKSGSFKFAHKSFMEYLFAEVLSKMMIKEFLGEDELEMNSSIIKSNETNLLKILEFTESVAFFAELTAYYMQIHTSAKDDELPKKLYNLIVLKKPTNFLSRTMISSNVSQCLYMFSMRSHKSSIRRFLSMFLQPHMLTMMIASIIAILYVYSSVPNMKLGTSDKFTNKLILLSCFGALLPGLLTFVNNTFSTRRRIFLWYHCCQALEVQPELISKVIGKKPLRYLSDKEFGNI